MPLLLVAGFLLPFDGSSADPEPASSAGERAYRSLPALPIGASERGAAGVEESAIELANVLKAIPVEKGGELCPTDRLQVVWEEPKGEHGAVIHPLGPAPDAATEQVNGAVVCEGAPYAYMGFEAKWDAEADRWDVVAVPFIDEEEAHLAVQPNPAPSTAPQNPTFDRAFGAGIEGYAAYEPQRTCDPTPKGGTLSMQRMLLNGNPGSRNLGISRGCGNGGTSEHKEGRAFDWGVYVTNARERAQAEGFIEKILATDAGGNRHAIARRMGVMYVIWNRKIWSAYRAGDGWRPYSGASAHTDHVHISLSWAGALGRTSFWSGTVPADLVAMPSAATVPASSSRRRSSGASRTSTTEGGRRRSEAPQKQSREELMAMWQADPAATRRELEARYGARGTQLADWLERRGRRGDGDGERDRDDEATTTTEARRDRQADWEERRREWQERIEAEEARRREQREEREDAERERREEQREEREAAEERRREEWMEDEAERRERRAEYERRVREAIEAERRRRQETTTTTAPATAPAPSGDGGGSGSTDGGGGGGGRRWRGRGGWRQSPPTTAAPAPAPTTTTTAAPAPTTTVAPTTTTAAPATTTTVGG